MAEKDYVERWQDMLDRYMQGVPSHTEGDIGNPRFNPIEPGEGHPFRKLDPPTPLRKLQPMPSPWPQEMAKPRFGTTMDFRGINTPGLLERFPEKPREELWRDPEAQERERQAAELKATRSLPWQTKLFSGILPALPIIPGKTPGAVRAQGMRRLPSGTAKQMLGQTDERALVAKARQGDPASLAEFMSRAQPLINEVAKRFAGRPGKEGQEPSVSREELANVANTAIISALTSGKSKAATRENMSSYIYTASKNAMLRFVGTKKGTIQLPRGQAELRAKISQLEARHAGRSPNKLSSTAIAAQLGLPKMVRGIPREQYVDRIRADIETKPEQPMRLSSPAGKTGLSLEEVVPEAPLREDATALALEKLDKRSKEFLLRNLAGESFRSIAKNPSPGDPTVKPLNFSRVQQIINKAKETLKGYAVEEPPPQSLGAAAGPPTDKEFDRWASDYARFVMGKAPAPEKEPDPEIVRQLQAQQGPGITNRGSVEADLSMRIAEELRQQGETWPREVYSMGPNLMLDTSSTEMRPPVSWYMESAGGPMMSIKEDAYYPRPGPPSLTPEAYGYAGIRPRPIGGGSDAPERFMTPGAHRLLNILGLVSAQQGGFRSVGPRRSVETVAEPTERIPSPETRAEHMFGSDMNIPGVVSGFQSTTPEDMAGYLRELNQRLQPTSGVYRDPRQRDEWELLLHSQLGRRLP